MRIDQSRTRGGDFCAYKPAGGVCRGWRRFLSSQARCVSCGGAELRAQGLCGVGQVAPCGGASPRSSCVLAVLLRDGAVGT